MKVRRLTVCCAVFLSLLLLFPIYKANCQDYIDYKVQVRSDGSAAWTITQASDLNGTIDTWEGFQVKIFNLVDSAATLTHREMAVDENSLQINTTISSGSKTTEYMFVWQNFSSIGNNELSFGDVFHLSNFFGQLYGDAALQISYPSEFAVKSVYPAPNERDDSLSTMGWFRTQDLVDGKTNIDLMITSPIESKSSDWWQQYALVAAALTVGITVSLAVFFAFRRRRFNDSIIRAKTYPSTGQIENDEDKIINYLKGSGGVMRQSAITEQSRFSKAKTSQLLAALEKKAVITRYKKGRDKIVTLNERVKGEKK